MAVRIHGGVIEESGWQIRNISENYALFYSWNHLLEKEGKKKKKRLLGIWLYGTVKKHPVPARAESFTLICVCDQ